ncbi:hypothetical protein JHK82_033082 [Glycine max]|uniref:Uncharacterized protein n=1 Tax=Glycine max TaxID=3847 RepID=A0A0R0H2N3_SOYBN|nr:hypothetical protein JHK85_033793 [Glycine max]KAG5118662.1 hypothetical protein JHK82_033082 [Glycine max]KAG5139652.1 hypothetical protein JHK84_033420 [Glycine max]
MGPNIDFDTLWGNIGYEKLEYNTNKEVMRLILQSQQQVDNTVWCKHRRKVVNQNHEEGHGQLFNDHFSPNLACVSSSCNGPSNHDEYFPIKVDAMCRNGLSPLEKCIVALRILAYGSPANNVDEYIHIVETTIVDCLQRLVSSIYTIFGDEYLRRPDNKSTRRLL